MSDTNHIQPATLSTLTLDGTYQPIGFFSARAAIKHLITGKAKAYDRYGNLQNWDGWIDNTSYHFDSNPYMNSASRRVDIPTIMVISHFFGSRQRQKPGVDVKGTSLRYLYKLYNGTCQYCLEHIPMNKATKDHVFPKSQGGPNCATNLVLACKRCNALKADTFPYFNKDGEEPKVKNLSPFHHHTVYGPGMIRDEWKFFLHVN